MASSRIIHELTQGFASQNFAPKTIYSTQEKRTEWPGKKIREYDAKRIILENIKETAIDHKAVLVNPATNMNTLSEQYPWLLEQNLVVKPDQLFGKRKKHGLVLVNVPLEKVVEFVREHMHKEVTVGKVIGKLTHFLIEPFVPHEKEYYLAFTSKREHDIIYFSKQGGIDIEENWDNVCELKVPTLQELDSDLLKSLTQDTQTQLFIKEMFELFRNLDFSYLEINPFAIKDNTVYLLDAVAHIDSCAEFKSRAVWKDLRFPKEFGKKQYKEEVHIEEIDKNSGASLKLSILNPNGKIWNVLGGGGASIIYLDMIANLGKGNEIANYGEASGNPSTEESYEYAKSILNLMIQSGGKILFIVGGIANFTDIRKTFQGYIQALNEYGQTLQERGVTIFIRRGGPHDTQGLELIKRACEKHGITTYVHGAETSMPQIIQIAQERL